MLNGGFASERLIGRHFKLEEKEARKHELLAKLSKKRAFEQCAI
eukprot:SAG11_NODE_7348_length_1157_cov_1.620983_2_plen_44_part_00